MDAESADGAAGGRLITETFGYEGGRRVTVYVPPQPPEAIAFAGDGQLVAGWGEDADATDGPNTMIVGVGVGVGDQAGRATGGVR